MDPAKFWLKDKNRCWIALKYTKPRTNSTTPMFIDPNNKRRITIQAKEGLVRGHVFLRPLIVY